MDRHFRMPFPAFAMAGIRQMPTIDRGFPAIKNVFDRENGTLRTVKKVLEPVRGH